MKKVLVFAGTTEGRELAELLADSNIKCSVCVATDYAFELMKDKRLDVHCGRLTEEEMEVLMRDGKFDVVVDATHPYAQIVSQNVRQAADKESISLIRLRRLGIFFPKVGLVGDSLAIIMTLGTLSFLVTTPEVWVPNLGSGEFGFPLLSGAGRLVIKDIVILAGAVVLLSDSSQRVLKTLKKD